MCSTTTLIFSMEIKKSDDYNPINERCAVVYGPPCDILENIYRGTNINTHQGRGIKFKRMECV